MKTTIRIGILALTLSLLAGGEVWGQSRFDGSTDASWSTAANWTPEAVPTISSNVVIGTTNAAVGAGGSPKTATITAGDTCTAASLTLGEHAGNSGTLNMDGGTLTLPAAGNITIAGQTSSTGTLSQTGGTLAGITSGSLAIAGGQNSVGTVVLGGTSAITSSLAVASTAGAVGAFTLTNTAVWKATGAVIIGSASNAAGLFTVSSSAVANMGAQNLTLGSSAFSTGQVTVGGSGQMTNIAALTVGGAGGGYGQMTVSDDGKVLATTINVGGTNNNSTILATSNAYVAGQANIGNSANSVGTVILSNNAVWWGGGYDSVVGNGANAVGYLYLSGNAKYTNVPNNYKSLTLGNGAGSTGIVQVTDSGSISNVYFLTIGNNKGYGEMTVSGSGAVYVTASPYTPGQIYMNPTGGVSSVLTVTNTGYVTGIYSIGGGVDGMATITLSGSGIGVAYSGSGGAAFGNAVRATGRLYVRNNAVFYGNNGQSPVFANNYYSTGIVEVSDFGVITNHYCIYMGSGHGEMTVRDNGAVYSRSDGWFDLSPTGGVSSSLTVTNSGHVRYLRRIGGGADSIATVTLTGNSSAYGETGGGTTLGQANRSTGYLYVRSNAVFVGSTSRSVTLGSAIGSTGIVEVTDFGVITNIGQLVVGTGAGYGSCAVRNSGKVFIGGATGTSIGGTNNNSILTVADNGEVRAGSGITYIGNAAGASGTLTLTNNGYYVCGTGSDMLQVGVGNNSLGWVNINGGTLYLPGSGREFKLGTGTGATGVLTITSGVYSNGNTLPYYPSSIGFGPNSLGRVDLQGGKLYEGGLMRLGAGVGSVGRAMVTGGTWDQRGDLEIGATAGGTGLVTVANCVQTNIAGPVKVGGGATVGDRYGLVTVSNATFGGYAAATDVNVWTNGFVELTGTGSVFVCDTFTVTGGAVTNRVRQFAGGVDVLNSAATSLVITNGGKVHIAFEEIPSSTMTVWGLRWAGNNRSNDIQRLLDRGVLTWSQAAGPTPGIQTNATQTWFGYAYTSGFPPAIDQGHSVTANINEDAGTINLRYFVSATDSDSSSAQLSWTNTTTPANGTVVCTGTGTNPATLTYTGAGNFYGTNSFLVRVADEMGRADSATVTVVVAASNDPPVCTARPTVSGQLQLDGLLSATSGTWNDTADTNFGGSSTLAYSYEWQYSTTNDGTGVISLGVFSNQYTVAAPVVPLNYVRIQVTCTNEGVGTPQYQVVITNSAWSQIVSLNAAPVIDQGSRIATNMTEDGGTFQLTNLVITASDADGDSLTWTSTTTPANGTVAVSGTGTNPVTWSAFTYTPATNFYGTNSFLVQAADGKGGTASITVEVAVAAVNDAPMNTTPPGIAGTPVYPNTLTATNGIWNDDADTNATYTYAVFTNAATFGYQWWRADNVSGLNSNSIANATNQTYALTKADRYKWLRVAVTCTDAGVGVPASQSVIAWTSWLQETSTAPATVTFTNTLGDGSWGSYSNWAPDTVPMTNITTVIGDTSVKSPVTAVIGSGDTAATKDLTLGYNTGASGSLNMSGGTLTGNGGLTLGNGSYSTGVITQTGGTLGSYNGVAMGYGNTSDVTWALSGSSVVTGLTGNFYMGGNNGTTVGVGSKTRLTVTGSAVWSNTFSGPVAYVAAAPNADCTLEANGGVLYLGLGNNTAIPVGSQPGSITRINVTGGRMDIVAPQGVSLAANATSTGIVNVTGGTLTIPSSYGLGIGAPGVGSVYVTNNGCLNASAISFGGAAGSNATMVVADNAVVTNVQVGGGGGILRLGTVAGNVSTLEMRGGRWYTATPNGGDYVGIGYAAGATGLVTISGGVCEWANGSSGGQSIGTGAGSLGRVRLTGGILTTSSGGGWNIGASGRGEVLIQGGVYNHVTVALTLGAVSGASGLIQLQSGSFTNSGATTLGYAAGTRGTIDVSGGTWVQSGTLDVGTRVAGVTGVVTVANCVQTNIIGAMTVGGGGVVGDRYGSVTLSNATFGGTAAVTVWTNGFVELNGTGSVLRCSTFTCRGGSVTNHVRQLPGGLDLTGTGSTALTVTNGGAVYLLFDEAAGSGVSGDFWGLRWKGNNHAAALAALTNANALSWGGAASAGVGIYTNAAYTFVGYFINTAPVVTNAGKTVTVNMSEDGAPVAWAAAGIGATDAEGDTLTWTNGTVAPANGNVATINVSASNLTSYSYTPNANFNGTNTFTVRVMDGRGGADTCAVEVVVVPVNDAPVCTAIPTVSGLVQSGQTVSNDDVGAWNDAADTNVSGTSTLLFTRQWQTATNAAGEGLANIAGETNLTYAILLSDTGKYLRVQVTCTDDGVGSGGNQSVTTNSIWTLVTLVNALPTITNGAGPLVVTLSEDCGTTDLLATLNLGATDADPGQQATLVWTNTTAPGNGTVAVSGTGANPTTVTYTPNANFYGTNTFVVRVTDTPGGFDEIAVEVHVTAANDAPVNTGLPGITGTRLVGNTLTVTNGAWNDDADTNTAYTAATFAGQATFGYQWWRADNVSGLNSNAIAGATNSTYTVGKLDRTKWLGVAVTCTDAGVGVPANQGTTAWTSWLQETSTPPAAVTFTNTLGDGTWGSYSNWAPDWVPQATIATVIGDTAVKSPVTAIIGPGDTAAAKVLRLGNNAGANGTLEMSAGTLAVGTAFDDLYLGYANNSTGVITQTGGAMSGGYYVTVGNGAGSSGSWSMSGNATKSQAGCLFSTVAGGPSSYGEWTLSGSAVVTGQTAGTLSFASGSGSVARVVVQDSAVYYGTGSGINMASGQNSDSSVQVKGGRFLVSNGNSSWNVATATGSVGRLVVTGGSMEFPNTYGVGLATSAGSTGSLTVEGGTCTTPALGLGPGDGRIFVTNNGALYVKSLYLGYAAGSNGAMVVADSAIVTNTSAATLGLQMGMVAGNVATLELRGGSFYNSCGQGANGIAVGYAAGSTGLVTITGGSHILASGGTTEGGTQSLGGGSNALGRVAMSGGSLTIPGYWAFGYSGRGELLLSGGTFIKNDVTFYLGRDSGGYGLIEVTGGTWRHGATLGIGSVVAGATGVVRVANCVQTNITGAMTVGGGSTVGDRYGLVVISNATFGGTTAVSVWTNGFVELSGTGSVFLCSTFTCKGGSVTNRIQRFAGGVDVTSNAGSALVVTNGGTMRLVFAAHPEPGDLWGLRWAGNNHSNAVQALVVAGALSWDDSALSVPVGVFTNSTHTMVGCVILPPPGTVFTFR